MFWAIAILGAVVLSGVTSLWVVAGVGGPTLTPMRAAVVVVTMSAFAPWLLSHRSGQRFDLFSPRTIFLLCFLVLFAVRPLFELETGSYREGFLGYDYIGSMPKALTVAAVGSLAFVVGGFFARKPRVDGWWHDRFTETPDLRQQRSLIAILLSVSLVLFGVYVVQSGGIGFLGTYFQGRNDSLAGAKAQSSGYLSDAPFAMQGVALWRLALAKRWRSLEALPGWILLLYSVAPALGPGDRSLILPVALGLFIVKFGSRGARPSALIVGMALIVGFVFGITLPRTYRSVQDTNQSFSSSVVASVVDVRQNLDDLFGGADTAMVDAFSIQVRATPVPLGYEYGSSYLGALARPIPRQIWTEKPLSADQAINSVLFPSTYAYGVGFSFSIFGEPYLNGGFWGVVLVMALVGLVSQKAYLVFSKHYRNTACVVLYAVTLPYLIVYMRGSIGTDYQRQVLATVPVLLIMWFAARPGRSSSEKRSTPTGGVRVSGPNC